MNRRSGALSLAFAASILTTGCANPRLYNSNDDSLAKKASDAVEGANLKSALVPERAAMLELAKREQEAVRRDQYGLRDRKISRILSATTQREGWDQLAKEISDRITDLAGSTATSREIESAASRRDDAAAKLPNQRQIYYLASKGKVALSCPIAPSQRPAAGTELASTIQVFEQDCNAIVRASADLARLMGAKQLGTLNRQIAEIEAAQASYEADLEKAKAAFEEALAKSQAPADPPSKDAALATLKARFDELGNLPKPLGLLKDSVISKLGDAGKLEKLKAEKKAVDDLIQALDGQVPASGATSAQQRLAALRNLADAISAAPPPALTAAILESEHLRLETVGVERHIARAKERLALLRNKQASMVDELVFLNAAQRALDDYSGAGKCARETSLYSSFLKADSNCRFMLAQVLSNYVNAMTFGKAEQELIDYQLIAQGHEAALDNSETALAQTDNLMRVPAAQLAKAYGGGLRPEEISNLVNALGLGAIAVRVK
jgi:hypothetical protein